MQMFMPRPPRSGYAAILPSFALILAAPVAAQEVEDGVLDLAPLEVTSESATASAPSVSQVGPDRLDFEYQGAGLETVLRGLPGVTTQGGGADGGEIAVNIRGLQDYGRVAVTIDGMRQNFARSGHGANGTFATDSEMLREVTVSRGPGAKAGAVGGALELRSVRAEDLLPLDGGATGGEFRLRYGTRTVAPTLHGSVATQLSEAVDLTVAATRSELGDYTAPNGQRVHAWQLTRSGLATLGLTTQNGQRLSFSASRLAKDYTTGVSGSTPRDNDLRTDSLALGYEAQDVLGGWSVTGTLYDTRTRVWQQTLDDTLAPTGETRSYRTRTTGLLVEAQRGFVLAGRDHDVTLTFESFRDRAETVGTEDSLTPSGRRGFVSLAVEDRIALGAATLTLGLSADRYDLTGGDVAVSGTGLSPRLALDLPVGGGVSLHAAAALSYRFPSLNETLVSGLHPEPADFEIRPNPALQPEKFRNLELGVSFHRQGLLTGGDAFDLRATVFRNQARDYIGLERQGGLFDSYYQYVNIDRVRITGLELEAAYDSGRIFGSLAGQVMRGTNLDDGSELSRVPPDRLVLTAGVKSADARRRIGARFTVAGGKHESSLRSEAWRTVDLFLRQELSDSTVFDLSLNNITDATYTPHLETQPSPGFNAQASLIVRF